VAGAEAGSGPLGRVKSIYRLLPAGVRGLAAVHRFKALVQSYLLPHDWVYDRSYYTEEQEVRASAAAAIAASLARDLKPARVVDVGCGSGDLLAELRARGSEVFGLERSRAALEICRAKRLPVVRFDLESDSADRQWSFDVAISLEVAEHLPPRAADRYVDLLCALAPRVVLSAATPGQRGTDHINEQPPEYWRAKFERSGFELDGELGARWSEEWRAAGTVAGWYCKNLMVFAARWPAPAAPVPSGEPA
jgi:SAM-dependent methyltransferase